MLVFSPVVWDLSRYSLGLRPFCELGSVGRIIHHPHSVPIGRPWDQVMKGVLTDLAQHVDVAIFPVLIFDEVFIEERVVHLRRVERQFGPSEGFVISNAVFDVGHVVEARVAWGHPGDFDRGGRDIYIGVVGPVGIIVPMRRPA